MIPKASDHRVRMASPLTLVDYVDFVNRELGVLIAQARYVADEIFVLIGIEAIIFVEHGAYEVDVQVLVDEDEGDRQD